MPEGELASLLWCRGLVAAAGGSKLGIASARSDHASSTRRCSLHRCRLVEDPILPIVYFSARTTGPETGSVRPRPASGSSNWSARTRPDDPAMNARCSRNASSGGRSFGYNIVSGPDDNGTPVAGELKVNRRPSACCRRNSASVRVGRKSQSHCPRPQSTRCSGPGWPAMGRHDNSWTRQERDRPDQQ